MTTRERLIRATLIFFGFVAFFAAIIIINEFAPWLFAYLLIGLGLIFLALVAWLMADMSY